MQIAVHLGVGIQQQTLLVLADLLDQFAGEFDGEETEAEDEAKAKGAPQAAPPEDAAPTDPDPAKI